MKKLGFRLYIIILFLLSFTNFSYSQQGRMKSGGASSVTTCFNIPVTLEIYLTSPTGVSPYDISYRDETGSLISVLDVTLPYTFDVQNEGIYELISITDDAGTAIATPGGHTSVEVIHYSAIPLNVTIAEGPTVWVSAGSTISLTSVPSDGTGPGTYTYAWSGHPSVAGSVTNNAVFDASSVTPGSTYTVTSTVTDGNGCSVSDNVIVQVTNLQAVVASPADPALGCVGVALSLDGEALNGSGSYEYSWQVSSLGGNSGNFSNNTIADPTFTPSGVDTYNLTFTVKDVGVSPNVSASTTLTVNSFAAPLNKNIYVTHYCHPEKGTITIENSEVDVIYNLYDGAAFVDNKIGDGSDIVWSLDPGNNYNIVAESAITSCARDFPGPYVILNSTKPTVAPSIDDADDKICLGETTTLRSNAGVTGLGSSIDFYQWSPAGDLAPSATSANPDVTPSSSGIITYSVTVTDDLGCTQTGSVDLEVTPAPVLNILSSKNPICKGETLTLSATSDKEVASWYWGANPAAAGPAIGDNVVSPAVTTNYTLTVEDTDGCTTTESYSVTVNPVPTANAGLDQTMCLGAGATLTGSATGGTAPYTYSWSGGLATPPASTFVDPSPAAAYTYTLTVLDVNNCSDDDDVIVNAVANPTVDAGPDQSSCSGDLVSFTANPLTGLAPYTYSWEGGAFVLNTNFSDNPTNPAGSAPILVNYDVVIKDANGCIGTDDANVTVNSFANIVIANDGKKYCNDAGMVTLNATPTGGIWTELSGTIPMGGGNTFDVGLYPSGFYTFEYSYTGVGGCVSTKQATIEILPYGTPTLTDIEIESEPLFCSTDAGPYTIQGTMAPDLAGQAGVVESFSGNGVTDNGDGTADFNPSAAGIGIHTITYTVNTPGCSSTITEDVRVGTPVSINNPANMCVDDSDHSLVASDVNGEFTITFIDDATNTINVFGPYAHGDPNAVLQANEPGIYTVSYELTTPGQVNCSPDVTTVVYGLPTVNFTIDGKPYTDLDINFCENGSSITLSGNQPTNNVFTSVPDAVAGNQFDPTTGTGTYVITYTHTDANGCSNSVNSEVVTVNPTPVVTIDNLNASYCENDAAFTITGSPLSGTAGFGSFSFPLSWADGVQYTNNANGTAEIDPTAVTITGGYNISYQVTDLNGCLGSVTRNVDFNPSPTVDFNGLPATICKNGSPVTLIGSPTDAQGSFIGDGISDHGNGTATFDPSGISVGTHTITYSYFDIAVGCANSVQKNIEVLALPDKYTVTTPGGSSYCENSSGITIGISNSQAPAPDDYYYHLVRNGVTTVDTQVGTGAAVSFAGTYTSGNYSVVAENTAGCRVTFNNTVTSVEEPVIDDAGSISGNTSVCADGLTIYTYSVPAIANATDHVWTTPVGVITDADRGNEIDVIFDPSFAGGDFEVYGDDVLSVCSAGSSSTLTVAVKPAPTVVLGATISGDNVVCEGEINKLYSIDPADFANKTAYEWETTAGTIVSNPTASSITVNFGAGSVSGTLRVRAINSCSASAWVTLPITVNPIPDVSVDPLAPGDVIDCSAGSQVQLNVSSTENPGDITAWSWTASNGGVILAGNENLQNPRVTHEGDFVVQIEVTKAGQACYNSATVTVAAEKDAPTVSIPGTYEIDCNNLTETINATGDTDPTTTYLWTGPGIVGPDNVLNITVDQPGDYTIVATSTNGCTSSAVVNVNDDTQAPDVTVASALELTCNRTSVQISGSSPTADIYKWTRQSGTGNITNADAAITTVDGPGVFRLTVTTSANGCSSFDDVTVLENLTTPGLVVTDPASSELTCATQNVQLEASAMAGTIFTWSTGIAGATISDPSVSNPYVNKAGIYTVIAEHPVTGCTQTDNVTVNANYQKPTINIVPNATKITCAQTAIQLDASTSTNANTFDWYTSDGTITGGSAASIATVSAAGTYTVIATNGATGCTDTGQVIITEDLSTPNVNVTGGPYEITCSDPTPVLTATADAGASLLWTGPGVTAGANTNSATVNMPGTYVVTATAANGCTSADNVYVAANSNAPNIAIDTTTLDITCARASVNVTGTSITPGATYSWQMLTGGGNVTNPTSQTASVDAAGTYELTVTAPNGCTNSDIVTVEEDKDPPVITLPATDDELLTCNQATVTLNASATPAGSQYAWSTLTGATITNPNSATPVVDMSGDYTVTVTDPSNGCTATATTTVTDDLSVPTINITPVVTQISCTNPTIVLDASTSTDAINYKWTASLGGNIVSNANTANPTINAAGRYTVTAEHNATGCTASEFIDITQDSSVPVIDVFDASPGDITCSNPTVILTGDATGVVNKDILWTTSDGNILFGAASPNPEVNADGTYILTVTNLDNGCYTVRGVTVDENKTSPTLDFDTPLDLTCTRNQVNLKANSTSADGSPLKYEWTAGAGGNIVSGATTSTPVVDKVADYNLTVTDQGNGCASSSFVTVSIDTTKANVIVDLSPDQITCTRATVILDGYSDHTNVSYQWTTTGSGTIVNSTTPNPTVNAIGTYNLKVTNLDNGCVSTSSNVLVTENKTIPAVTVFAPSGDLTCNTTEVTVSVSSDPDYTYSWSGPGNITTPFSNSTDVDAIGTYTVIVEDIFSGCTITKTVDVDEDITPIGSPVINNIEKCFGAANPTFNVISGTNVQWYDDPALNVFLSSGNLYTPTTTAVGTHTYYATSTGANGCESLPVEITFTIHDLPIAPTTIDNAICEGSAAKNLTAIGSNINWYDNTSAFIQSGSTYAPTDNLPGIYTYHATQTDAEGCESAMESATYTVNSVPAQPVFTNPNLEICETETNPTFNVVGSNIKWFKTIGGAAISIGNTYQPIDVIPGTYNYHATQTENTCESPEATGTFTINPMPEVYNVQNGGAYCEGTGGADITLSNSEVGVNYELWLDESDLITDIAGTGAALNFGNQTLEGNYTIYAYNAGTLCRYKMNGSVDIGISPLPGDAPTIVGSDTVCQIESGVTYSITPITNATNYVWTVPAGFTIVSGSNSNTITVDIDDTAVSGNITVYAENACGAGTTSPVYHVTVNPIPGPALNLTGPNVICKDSDGITYSIDPVNNATYYNWTLPQGASIISGFGSRQVSLNFDQTAVNDVITVTAANGCGEGASASQLITVNDLPYVSAGEQQDLCVDNTVLDGNAIPVGGTGEWTIFNGAATFSSVSDPTATITDIGEGNNRLIWTVEDANGCTLSDTVLITNNTVIVEAGNNKVICDEEIQLGGSAVPTGATGSWSVIPGSGSASFTDGTNPITYASGFDPGINILKWSVTKGGCTNYDTVTINNQRPTQAYAGIDISVCGDSAQLNANNPAIGTGLWTVVIGAANFENDTLYNTKISGLSKGENIIRWTISNGICSTSDELTITNNKVVVNAGVDQIICNNTTTLDATELATGTAYWSIMSGSASFINDEDPKTVVTGLSQGNNVLTWNINNNSCISSDSVSITNDSPTPAYAGADTTVTSDLTTLQGNIPAVGTGSWSLISGSGIIDDPLMHNTTVSSLGLGDNKFRWTVTHNSCISTDDVIITNANSQPPDAGADQTLCSDVTILEANEPMFGFGEWSVVQGSATFTDVNNPATKVTGLAKGDNVLRWSIWENGWSSDDVIITNDSPSEAIAGLDQVLCSDSTFLAGNDPIVGKGKWTVVSGAGTFENDSIYNTKVTNLAKGENIFKWTISNRACSDEDVVIIRNDLPTIAQAGSDAVVCQSSITLSPNTPTVGTGYWSVAQGSAYFEGNTAKNIARGDNIFVWTIENNACSYADSINITNYEPSDANAGADKIICVDTITLKANTAIYGTGVWTQESGSSTFDPTSATTSVTNLSQGLNVFKWTITYNGCVKSDRVTINNASVNAVAGLDDEICSESTYLEADNPSAGTGMWSVLGGSGSAKFTNINDPDTWVTELDRGDNVLRWTITNEICSDYDDVVITNNLPTEAFAGPDQALCADNSILQGNTPVYGTGEWSILSGSANITSINDASSTVSDLNYGVNTLRWTITNGSCVSTDEVVIANNSTITSNAGLDQTLCVDSTILYANVPTYGVGTWSVVTGSATFENNNDYNTKVKNVGKGNNVLRWVIANGGCSSSDEVTITNNAPSKAIAGADQTICGNSTTLQANSPTYGSGSWALVSGAAEFNDPTKNNTGVTGLNPGLNTLRWTVENSGCTSSDDVIIYNDLPYEAYAGEDFSVCGSTSSLYANDPVIGVGEWTVVSGYATFNDSSRYDASVQQLAFGANTLRWTITYDNCTTYDEVVVTNNKIQVYAGVDQTITESTTLLAANNPSTGAGQWSVIGGFGNFASPNNSITEVYDLGAGLNTFRWSVDVNGCISYDDVSITYNVPPVASFVVTKSEGCPPLDVYFVNNSLDDLPFTWDFDDGNTSSDITIKHTYTEPGIYKPSLTVISNEGVAITRDTTIIVFDQPEASFLIVNRQVYIPEEEAIFVNTSTSANTYQWNFGDGGTSTESDPKYVYTEEGIYDILLEVWSVNNCYDSTLVKAGVEVLESGTTQFPNAFTPNLDGPSGGYYNPNDFTNDVFFPIGAEGIDEYHLEIFNKWGILVFESKDVNIGWDGYYNGNLLNEGVYVWKVSGTLNNGKPFKEVGTVLLLR